MSLSYNKVVVNNQTIIDLTEDTVTSANLLSGIVAHDSTGKIIFGDYQLPSLHVSEYLLDSSGNQILDSSGNPIEADLGYVSLVDHYTEVEGLKHIIAMYREALNS